MITIQPKYTCTRTHDYMYSDNHYNNVNKGEIINIRTCTCTGMHKYIQNTAAVNEIFTVSLICTDRV